MKRLFCPGYALLAISRLWACNDGTSSVSIVHSIYILLSIVYYVEKCYTITLASVYRALWVSEQKTCDLFDSFCEMYAMAG